VLISTHGTVIRALLMHLDGISETDIVDVNVPTGIPLVYELDADLRPIRHRYLADDATVKAAIEKIVAQGKATRN
jgi:2,3-bisphosphoglycerate-dependent phosphoglycerate mutase